VAFRSQPVAPAWTVKRVEDETCGGAFDKGIVPFSGGSDIELRILLVTSSRER